MPRWAGILPAVLGVLFLVSAAYYEARLAVFGTVTSGRVGYRPVSTPEERRSRKMRIEYEPVRGSGAFTGECRQTVLLRERFTFAQPVEVRYLPGDTEICRIDNFRQFWFAVIVKPVVGVLLTGFGLLLWRRGRRGSN